MLASVVFVVPLCFAMPGQIKAFDFVVLCAWLLLLQFCSALCIALVAWLVLCLIVCTFAGTVHLVLIPQGCLCWRSHFAEGQGHPFRQGVSALLVAIVD